VCREKNIPTPVHDAVVATIREAEKRKQSPRLEPEQLYERIVGSPFSHRHRRSHTLLALLLVVVVVVVVALRYVALH
jgi:preprotein translocase subunit SecF